MRIKQILVALFLVVTAGVSQAEPSWWAARGVYDPAKTAEPNGIALQGQGKHVAGSAFLEFQAIYAGVGGAGPEITNLVNGFTTTHNHAPLQLGQLKALAAPFYNRLIQLGVDVSAVTGGELFPWTPETSDDADFAPATLGQLRHVFSFDLPTDAFGVGLVFVSEDWDGDGLSNAVEFIDGTNPYQIDTDGDGYTDDFEKEMGKSGTDPADHPAPVQRIRKVSRGAFYNFSEDKSIEGEETAEGSFTWLTDWLFDSDGTGLFSSMGDTEILHGFYGLGAPHLQFPAKPVEPAGDTTALYGTNEVADGTGYHTVLDDHGSYAEGRVYLESRVWVENQPLSATSRTSRYFRRQTTNIGPSPAGAPGGVNTTTSHSFITFTTAPGDQFSAPRFFGTDATAFPGQAVFQTTAIFPLDPSITIEEVRFAGSNYHELKSDNGLTTYGAPQWVDSNGDSTATTNPASGEKNYPVAFTRNTKPQLGAKLKVLGLGPNQSVRIKASPAQGEGIPPANPDDPPGDHGLGEETWDNVAVAADGTIDLALKATSKPLNDSIQFHNADDDSTAFTMADPISIARNALRQPVDSLGQPLGQNPQPDDFVSFMQETLFNLGCRNADGLGSSDQEVVDAIFEDFKDRNVQKVIPSRGTLDGNGMKYWGGAKKTNTAGLLSHGDGRCAAWSEFFTDVLRTQGVDAKINFFKPPQLSQAMEDKFNADLQFYYQGFPGQFNIVRILFVKNWNLVEGENGYAVDENGEEINPFSHTYERRSNIFSVNSL